MKNSREQILQHLDQTAISRTKSKSPATNTSLPLTDSNEPYQFLSKVKKYCRERLSSQQIQENIKCIFAFIPYPKIRLFENLGSKKIRLNADFEANLHGRIILALDSNLSHCRIIDVRKNSDGEIHDDLCESLCQLESEARQELCHAIISLEKARCHQFPEGASGPNELVNLNQPTVTYSLVELENFAEELHEVETKYPMGFTRIWEDQTNYKLASKPEERITARFVDKLQGVLGIENVSSEPNFPQGRADVLIHSSGLQENCGPCVMEFKVLSPSGTPKKNRKWLCKGVYQARDYGGKDFSKSRYLMSYDARKKETEVLWVTELAAKYDVNYKTYRIYNTTPAPREEEFEGFAQAKENEN